MEYGTNKPMAYVQVRVDYKALDQKAKNEGVSPGDFILFAIAKNIQDFPEFNSGSTEVNIGYLLNLGKGTKIALIQRNTAKDISKEVKEQGLKYLHEELPDDNYENSTIGVSNLQAFNASSAFPPIYKDHSAMISIASPIDNCFNITLSYDATVADCQKALEFLNAIKKEIQT